MENIISIQILYRVTIKNSRDISAIYANSNACSCVVCFCCVCFRFSLLSQEISWEERLQNNLLYVEWDVNQPVLTLTLALTLTVTKTLTVTLVLIGSPPSGSPKVQLGLVGLGLVLRLGLGLVSMILTGGKIVGFTHLQCFGTNQVI